MSTEQIFTEMNDRLTPEKASKINSTYLFDIAGEKYLADLTKGEGPWISKVDDGEAKCTITVNTPEDWEAIATGKMNATAAFMQNKLKVKGDMALAMKLQGLLG